MVIIFIDYLITVIR